MTTRIISRLISSIFKPRTVVRGLSLLALFFAVPSAQAFNSLTHIQILKSAFHYISTHPSECPNSRAWVKAPGFQEVITRAVVDADFELNVSMGSHLFGITFPASSFGILNPFTTVLHHIDTQRVGQYWPYDGFSFQDSTRAGRDLFLAIPSIFPAWEFSPPLGGKSPYRSVYGGTLPQYDLDFGLSQASWKKLYQTHVSMRDVIFPPANVPAELAYHEMLASPRARIETFDHWEEEVPAITTSGAQKIRRAYWRGELAGLPTHLDFLGLTIHMAQDMGVPQHTQSTVDNCHTQLELYFDQLACAGVAVPEEVFETQSEFVDGSYDRGWAIPECQGLYRESAIGDLISSHAFLKDQTLSMSERIVDFALNTAKWRFKKRLLGGYHSIFAGQDFQANSCEKLFALPVHQAWVKNQMTEQYNLSVAMTVIVLEKAAREYEALHPLY